MAPGVPASGPAAMQKHDIFGKDLLNHLSHAVDTARGYFELKSSKARERICP